MTDEDKVSTPDNEPVVAAKPDESASTEQAPNEPDGSQTEGSEGDSEGHTSDQQAPKNKDKQVPWFQKRIDKLTAQKAALSQQLEAELQSRTEKPVNQDAPQKPARAGVDPAALHLAKQIVEAEKFNDRCNNLVSEGTTKFSDFQDVMTNMRSVGAIGPEADPGFISAVLELKDPVKIFHTLGKDPDEVTRILSLSPTKQVIELTRLEERLQKPKSAVISKAPAPITPVGGAAKAEPDLNDGDLPMEQWIALRDKTRRTRQ